MSRRDRKHGAFVSLAASLLLSCAGSLSLAASAEAQAPSDRSVVHLNQAWSDEDREWYYHFSQGAAVLSYDIFLNLEVAGGQELFRSDANSVHYGLIPEGSNWMNPDGLPIGISKTNVATTIGDWPAGDYAGVTCAMCHETQLNYKGKHVRIDGGPANTFDMQAYLQALNAAMQATLTDTAKFDRLASRLGAASPEAKAKLRQRLAHQAAATYDYATRSAATFSPWGPAGIDALSMINNRLTANLPGIPENTSTPIAPVKPPFLWNAPQGLWTQWAAIVQDPIARNLGETMGVFMPIDLRAKTPAEGLFDANAAIPELQRVEHQLERLAPPSWPEDVFGKIDREKAKKGKALFMVLCSGCHNAWPYTWMSQTSTASVSSSWDWCPNHMWAPIARSPRPSGLSWSLANSAIICHGASREVCVPIARFQTLPSAPSPRQGLRKAEINAGATGRSARLSGAATAAGPRTVSTKRRRATAYGRPHHLCIMARYRTSTRCWCRPANVRKNSASDASLIPSKLGLDTTCGPGDFPDGYEFARTLECRSFVPERPARQWRIGPLLTDDQRWALVEYLKSIPAGTRPGHAVRRSARSDRDAPARSVSRACGVATPRRSRQTDRTAD